MRVLWSTVCDATLWETGCQLRAAAKELRLITVADLVAAHPRQSVGLYAFFDGDDWAYIGKASSRAFIERVPSHLDVRPEGWFGTLLKKLAHRRGQAQDLSACVGEALDLRLALLAADLPDIDLGTAETEFRHAFRPALNAPKRPRLVDVHNVRLSEFQE